MKNVMKSKILIPVSFFLLILCFSVGVTFSYMSDSQKITNKFDPAAGKLKIEEPGYDEKTDGDRIMKPGMSAVKDPVVKNTGEVPLYVFLKVTVPVKNVRTVTEKVHISAKANRELFSYDIGSGWVQVGGRVLEISGAARTYVYINGPLAPGESTLPLFETVEYINILEGEIDPDEDLLMEVKAFGIQSDNLELTGANGESRAKEAYEIWKAGGTA